MQVIGLVGYMDKYDFVMNLARTINIMDKSVLVVDATLDQKLKYVVPALDNIGRSYVTQYNNIDFAVGFNSMHDIEKYMIEQGININLYDHILIDIDSPKGFELFRTRGINKTYLFLDTSVLSLSKNKELVKAMRVYTQQGDNLELSRVWFKAYLSRASQDYFDKQIEEYNAKWVEPEYEIPEDEKDKLENIDSQLSGIIDIKKHSKMFITTIADMTAEIVEDVNSKMVLNKIKRRRD